MTRWYRLFARTQLGWDQADSAWAALDILTSHPIRLDGVPVKGNAGITLGPLYYYLIAPVYFFTRYSITASPIFAGIVGIVGFVVFHAITRRLFSAGTALVASFIYVGSVSVYYTDSVQAAYTFIPLVSYAVFYCLFRFLNGSAPHVVWAAALIGFGFHLHITTVFYLPIVLITLPFAPKSARSLKHYIAAAVIIAAFLVPLAVRMAAGGQGSGTVGFIQSSWHGLHARRVLQLTHDALIGIEEIFRFHVLRNAVFVVPPVFFWLYYLRHPERKRLVFITLTALWFLVPWIGLSGYSGELTSYYFTLPRNIAIAMIAYILAYAYRHGRPGSILAGVALALFAVFNFRVYWIQSDGNFYAVRQDAVRAVRTSRAVEFRDHDPMVYEWHVYRTYRR